MQSDFQKLKYNFFSTAESGINQTQIDNQIDNNKQEREAILYK